MPKSKEIRSATVEASFIGDLTLVGTPIVYDSPTTIYTDAGSYVEIIHRGALDGCDLSDSHLLVNHDERSIPLARTPRTMRLNVTEKGLRMVAHLDAENAKAREVYSAVKRGDLTGMSFAFTVPDGGSFYDAATNTRHITRIARVHEISIVNNPAYDAATVEARAKREADAKAKAVAKAERIIALARATRLITEGVI